MKNFYNKRRLFSIFFSVLIGLFSSSGVIANTCNSNLSPSLDASSFIVIKGVGDVTGKEAQVMVSLRDANGVPIPGVVVRLSLDNEIARIFNTIGKTDENGNFSSSLVSKVMCVANISAFIDTNGDGIPQAKMRQTLIIPFIKSLSIFNNGVGIDIENPDDSAILHINSSDRGILIPRIPLQGSSDRVTILNPATSLLIYNTNPTRSLKVGYVFFNGQDWQNFLL